MKVCYFGIYNYYYPRNRTLINGLRENGVEVIECSSRAKGLKKFFELYQKHKAVKKDYDIMIVGYLGQLIMPFAKLLSRRKIILDAFLSLYNSNVFDRRICKEKSLAAFYYYLLDWLACRLADHILLDTNAHIDYFVQTFNVDKAKFSRIFIGAYDKTFFPSVKSKGEASDTFRILWWGYMIPLHGIEFILQAAKLLHNKKITFHFIGGGVEKKNILAIAKKLDLKNVTFENALEPEELRTRIIDHDLALGIFGVSSKTQLVVPNKIYEAFACRRPIVTADTKAGREVLVDKSNCLLCKIGSGKDIAQKIMVLRSDAQLREKIAKQGYDEYLKKYSPSVLGTQLMGICRSIINET